MHAEPKTRCERYNRRYRNAVVAMSAIFAIAACNREFRNRNLDQVKPNMTQKEVESILGSPDRTEKSEAELETQKKTTGVTRYYYEHKGQTIELHFQNGRLTSRPDRLKED
jgi:Domain of Unknown Function with PDB structure (DUF3862)